MYCIVDINNNEHFIGDFTQVINSIYKWRVKEGILTFKTKHHNAESYGGYDNRFIPSQLYTIVMNFLWNNLERFGYIKFQQVK